MLPTLELGFPRMHIRDLSLIKFKNFEDLDIQMPEQPKLVVLCGENGTGKSSVIDGISSWRHRQTIGVHDPEFYAPGGITAVPSNTHVQFHEEFTDARATTYTRTAQRVTVEFSAQSQAPPQAMLDVPGPLRTIDLDQRIVEDYQRLVGLSIERLWNPENAGTAAGEIVSELVGAVAAPLTRLLPGLTFDGPEPLQQNSTFRFSKGSARGYAYKNLSGGEKSVFDLLLDVVVKRETYSDAVWCIDEPELHVNARIHGPLLRELLDLLPDSAQLWIATHSAGMLAEARRMHASSPDSVAFIDFGGQDFSVPVTLSPVAPDRAFWRSQLAIALGDLATLLAPAKVVLCEGNPDARDRPTARFDARCLEAIFGDDYPDVAFMSVGNADDVVGDRMDIGRSIEALVDDVEVLRVIDRDQRSDQQIHDLKDAGVRVLRHRHIERYLLDYEVLDALCEQCGRPDQRDAVRAALAESLRHAVQVRGKEEDDYKSAASQWITAARRILNIQGGGSTTEAFLRDTLAPLVTSELGIYGALKEDVFGES